MLDCSFKLDALNYISPFQQHRSQAKELATLKHHTIKQKHFRPASSPNLLTWAAKEQIRFLHSSNPEDWTIDSLAEHFPVAEEALKRILKSSRGILQEKDILQHDKEVLENWNNLHFQIESGDITEEDFEFYFKCFFNSQNNCLVANAVCQPYLPRPKHVKRQKRRGPLSLIVEDCLKLQEKEIQILLKEQIPSLSRQISSKLEDTALLFQKIALSYKRINKDNSMPSLPYVDVGKRKENHFAHKKRSPGSSVDPNSGVKSINVRKNKPSLSGTYISNKTVYDENGEFLYKIP